MVVLPRSTRPSLTRDAHVGNLQSDGKDYYQGVERRVLKKERSRCGNKSTRSVVMPSPRRRTRLRGCIHVEIGNSSGGWISSKSIESS